MGVAAALAAFRNDTLDKVARIVPHADADPETAAQDEEFWGQIQEAFALDRNIVNFNNGGCSPSPRIVMDAFRRQMEFSNQAPSEFMWQQLEPEVESVRRGLARVFEDRGMLDEAIELLERNVEAGVRGAETLRWLSRLYQARDVGTIGPTHDDQATQDAWAPRMAAQPQAIEVHALMLRPWAVRGDQGPAR